MWRPLTRSGEPELKNALSGMPVVGANSERISWISFGPRPQFTPTTSALMRHSSVSERIGSSPENVPDRSRNAICVMTGRPSAAARASSYAMVSVRMSVNVSSMSTSTSPSTRAWACSRNTARICWSVSPPGRRESWEIGPIEPATNTPSWSAAAILARRAAARLMGTTRSS